MNVTVVMVIEYGVLKVCLAFSDETLAQTYYDQLKQQHSHYAVLKAKCKLDDVSQLNLAL